MNCPAPGTIVGLFSSWGARPRRFGSPHCTRTPRRWGSHAPLRLSVAGMRYIAVPMIPGDLPYRPLSPYGAPVVEGTLLLGKPLPLRPRALRITLPLTRIAPQNLALNIAEHGFTISVFNRTYAKTELAVKRAAKENLRWPPPPDARARHAPLPRAASRLPRAPTGRTLAPRSRDSQISRVPGRRGAPLGPRGPSHLRVPTPPPLRAAAGSPGTRRWRSSSRAWPAPAR